MADLLVQVRELVKTRFNLNQSKLNDLLLEYTKQDMVHGVKLLLDYGANPTDQIMYETTPAFFIAAENGNLELVQLMVESGIDIDKCCMYPYEWENECMGALFFAAQHEHVDVVMYLLEQGANPNITHPNEMPPLFAAVCVNNLDLVKLLLEHGADPLVSDNECVPIMCYPIDRDNLEMCRLLIQYWPDQVDQDHYLLSRATKRGNIDIVRLLLDAGANIDHVCSVFFENQSPLKNAIKYNHQVMTLFLLLQGARPLLDMNEAIRRFSSKTDIQNIDQLFQNGEENQVFEDGNTILHIAAMFDNLELVINLLDRGLDPYVVNKVGQLPVEMDCHNDIKCMFLFHEQVQVIDKLCNKFNRWLASSIKQYMNPLFCLDGLFKYRVMARYKAGMQTRHITAETIAEM